MVRQQRVSMMPEDRFPLLHSRGSAKHGGRFKGKDSVDRSVRDCENGKVRDKDEVLRYMLNPPAYLQKAERTQNFRGKALSFGVMDWERLETWKLAAEGTKGTFFSDTSSSGIVTSSEEAAFTSLSRSSSISANRNSYGGEKHASSCSGASSSHKVESFRDYETARRGKLEEKKWAPLNADSSDRGYSNLTAELVKRLELDQKVGAGVGKFSPTTKYQTASHRSREHANFVDADTKKRPEERVKVDVDKRTFDKSSKLRSTSVRSSEEDMSSSEQQKMGFRTYDSTENRAPRMDLPHQPQHRKPKDIILLRPNKYALISHVDKQQASWGKNLVEEMQSNVSTKFLRQEDHSPELSSRIPHSCPLLFSQQIKVECQDNGCDTKGECSQPIEVLDRNQNSVGNPCVLDQEMPKEASRKGRHASPNRRFSFSFSQMGRSLSFKESSTVPVSSSPPHISAKSGPLTFDGSVYSNVSTRMKKNGHNRTRSSPLRRLIDPLMKPKTENRVSTHTANESSNPCLLTVNKAPREEEKQESSTVRALLQFTERKGVHLFQFVADNNSNNVLAATMKSSDVSTRFYTFCSVKEFKKKSSSWLRQGNKEKIQGFAYTIIGRMRTLTSFTSDFTTQKSESILFDIETNPGDQPMTNSELAAIVDETHCTTNPCDCLSSDSNEERWSTTIILPGGVHTPPKDGGALLPLIDRWKSRETCDCGGWDIGCKLRVLSDRRSYHFSKTSKPRTDDANSLQFFDQEQDRPTLTLVSLGDGLHSVEFDPSISLLQAFFISLTISSRQNRCPVGGDGQIKKKAPVKYASNPPVSPVGRV